MALICLSSTNRLEKTAPARRSAWAASVAPPLERPLMTCVEVHRVTLSERRHDLTSFLKLRRCGYLTGLERTRLEEALDRFDLCVVLGDALGCQMWIIEARSHDDSDTLDYSGFHVVDAVRL